MMAETRDIKRKYASYRLKTSAETRQASTPQDDHQSKNEEQE